MLWPCPRSPCPVRATRVRAATTSSIATSWSSPTTPTRSLPPRSPAIRSASSWRPAASAAALAAPSRSPSRSTSTRRFARRRDRLPWPRPPASASGRSPCMRASTTSSQPTRSTESLLPWRTRLRRQPGPPTPSPRGVRDTVRMPRFGLGMRWWLALAFAAIAALTSVAVAEVFRERSSKALRAHARDLAVGQAVSASDAISNAMKHDRLSRAMSTIADKRNLSLFVYDAEHGQLVTSPTSHRINVNAIPERKYAVEQALAGRRVVITTDTPRPAIVAALLIDEGVVLAYAV